jgi:hypothetical protein
VYSRFNSSNFQRPDLLDLVSELPLTLMATVAGYTVIASASEAIHGKEERVDCFVARAPLRKRFAFVAG